MSNERLQYIIEGLLSVGEPTFDEAGDALETMRAALQDLYRLRAVSGVLAEYFDDNPKIVAWVGALPKAAKP